MKFSFGKSVILVAAFFAFTTSIANDGKTIRLGKPVVIAVIDTGADLHHDHLKHSNFLWTNPGEMGLDEFGQDKSLNGIDDDGNGFVDDLHGWNFVGANHDLTDHSGHGTHIVGIIRNLTEQHFQKYNERPQVQVMILKYHDSTANNSKALYSFVQAVEYALNKGAQIINFSAGGPKYHHAEFAALKKAYEQKVLVVTAAGNKKPQESYFRFFPAAYALDNILGVAAINSSGQLLNSSNYGLDFVDIVAPGEKIHSSLPGNSFGKMTGTSQATAYVTGKMAILASLRGELTSNAIQMAGLISSADSNTNLKLLTQTEL